MCLSGIYLFAESAPGPEQQAEHSQKQVLLNRGMHAPLAGSLGADETMRFEHKDT